MGRVKHRHDEHRKTGKPFARVIITGTIARVTFPTADQPVNQGESCRKGSIPSSCSLAYCLL
jgi:hypothetical protein